MKPSLKWKEVTIDCLDVEVAAAFWSSVLGLQRLDDPLPGWVRLAPTVAGGVVLNFQPVPEAKSGKARIHLDVDTDDLGAAVGVVRALGGIFTGEVHVYDEGTVAVMGDPEGTEFCLVGPPGSAIPE